jgi:hypothetical protein
VSSAADTGHRERDDAGDEATLAELRAERARLWAEVNRLRAERREVEHYERVVARMESSVSWQVTAPLRSVKTLAIKLRRALDERRD